MKHVEVAARRLAKYDRDWWESLSPREQRDYLRDHRTSRYSRLPLKPLPVNEVEQPLTEIEPEKRPKAERVRKINDLKDARNSLPDSHVKTREHIDRQVDELRDKNKKPKTIP